MRRPAPWCRTYSSDFLAHILLCMRRNESPRLDCYSERGLFLQRRSSGNTPTCAPIAQSKPARSASRSHKEFVTPQSQVSCRKYIISWTRRTARTRRLLRYGASLSAGWRGPRRTTPPRRASRVDPPPAGEGVCCVPGRLFLAVRLGGGLAVHAGERRGGGGALVLVLVLLWLLLVLVAAHLAFRHGVLRVG